MIDNRIRYLIEHNAEDIDKHVIKLDHSQALIDWFNKCGCFFNKGDILVNFEKNEIILSERGKLELDRFETDRPEYFI